MRRVIPFLVLQAVLLGADPVTTLSIDHVTAAGVDLEKMQANLASIGLRSEFGGPHNNHATQMAITSFPDGSYLELIAVQRNADPKAVAGHYWTKRITGNAGPTAWAVRSNDASAEVKRLKAQGVVTGGPTPSGRTRPDGVKLEWEAATVGPEPNGMFFPFLIRDFTSREKRVYPSGKPTTQEFTGISKVVIAVQNMDAAVERYRMAYGLARPVFQNDPGFGARLAQFEGTPVVLAAPLDAQSWLASRIAQVGVGPCAFILRGSPASAVPGGPKARWFGKDIAWFDSGKLGWRLGVER